VSLDFASPKLRGGRVDLLGRGCYNPRRPFSLPPNCIWKREDWMTDSVASHNLAVFHGSMLAAFRAEELRRFSQGHSLFQPILAPPPQPLPLSPISLRPANLAQNRRQPSQVCHSSGCRWGLAAHRGNRCDSCLGRAHIPRHGQEIDGARKRLNSSSLMARSDSPHYRRQTQACHCQGRCLGLGAQGRDRRVSA
jgi:hypothetical protein